MTRRLEGSVALVTGASRGIGAAVCRRFAQEGALVAINHPPVRRMAELAEALEEEIRDSGVEAMAICGDVSDKSDVDSMVAAIQVELGAVTVLVNNAAHFAQVPWFELSTSEWDTMMRVNLRGALLCAQAVYPAMRSRHYGKIITVSSVMVALGIPGALHYVTSKAGLIGFTRALAREVGHDRICVNSVMPGAILTEQELENNPDPQATAERASANQCVTRRGTAEDLEGLFAFLASRESDFITGQVFNVDGGWAHY